MDCGTHNNKPNFLIVGAAKAGTTSLAKYLGEHPDIYIPDKKEPRFFVKDVLKGMCDEDPLKNHILKTSVLNEKEYYDLYNVKEKLRGDASVHYLYHHKEAIPEIKKHLGDVPIIIMLRNPVNRLISNYKFLKSYGLQSVEIEVEKEIFKKENNYNSFWFIKELGLYSDSINAFMNSFTNVKIIIFEDFIKKPKEIYNDSVQWLGLQNRELKNLEIHNQSLEDKIVYRVLRKFGIIFFVKLLVGERIKTFLQKQKINFFSKKIKVDISSEFRKELVEFYTNDILRLEQDFKLDLNSWKKNFNI